MIFRRKSVPLPIEPIDLERTVQAETELQEIDRLVAGAHHNPHALLGAHRINGSITIRALRPLATEVTVLLDDETERPMVHHHNGLFTVTFEHDDVPNYRLRVAYGDYTLTIDDPYRWLPTVGEMDRHLFSEGRHERLWTVLGAHERSYTTTRGDVRGISFAVWAPNAQGVRVIGDHNHWDGRIHPMRSLGSSGIWELFIPDLPLGSRYKYAILGADGQWHEHADPYAQRTEIPPATASVTWQSNFQWNDAQWLDARSRSNPWQEPMSIYEVHLGSWRKGLSYLELADQLTSYLVEHNFTHVELMPVMEHPFGGSWGYHVTSYFAPTARFGDPDQLRTLIDRLHQAGIGVILDWVPAHFPRDAWALARFDGTSLYEHPDPRRGEHPDWGSFVFDFGRNEVRNFLIASALYWLEEFHVDGLRVDGVASMLYLDYSRKEGEWIPNQYGGRENLDAVRLLQEFNATAYRNYPGVITIAEESTAWPGVTKPTDHDGLGFGFKWNMGWMHDSLVYLGKEPVHRKWHHDEMTFSMVYAYSENFVLPISHDEVVHGKGSMLNKVPGDRWQQLATLRAYYAFMWAHPGKQLLFMGSEFGQHSEWAESQSLDWGSLQDSGSRGLADFVRDLNAVYRAQPAFWQTDTDPQGFQWLISDDRDGNTFAFMRRDSAGQPLVCVVNFSPVPQERYRLPLPIGGTWKEILNSDAAMYGGSDVGNLGVIDASDQGDRGQPASAIVRVPPLASIWFAPASS
jgi:1,4-alpha-glucan branching enzyme